MNLSTWRFDLDICQMVLLQIDGISGKAITWQYHMVRKLKSNQFTLVFEILLVFNSTWKQIIYLKALIHPRFQGATSIFERSCHFDSGKKSDARGVGTRFERREVVVLFECLHRICQKSENEMIPGKSRVGINLMCKSINYIHHF